MDASNEILVLASSPSLLNKGEVPVFRVLQIRHSAIQEGPEVVQCGRGMMVGLQESVGVWLAVLSIVGIDIVPSVAWNLPPVDDLR
jgi:hypothetical protein